MSSRSLLMVKMALENVNENKIIKDNPVKIMEFKENCTQPGLLEDKSGSTLDTTNEFMLGRTSNDECQVSDKQIINIINVEVNDIESNSVFTYDDLGNIIFDIEGVEDGQSSEIICVNNTSYDENLEIGINETRYGEKYEAEISLPVADIFAAENECISHTMKIFENYNKDGKEMTTLENLDEEVVDDVNDIETLAQNIRDTDNKDNRMTPDRKRAKRDTIKIFENYNKDGEEMTTLENLDEEVVDDVNDIETLATNQNISDTDNEDNRMTPDRKRAKRGKPDKKSWVCEKNKYKRMSGQEYYGRRKNEQGKTVYDVVKSAKKIKPRCFCNAEKNKYKFQCKRITDEIRTKIYSTFWNMTWKERKVFVKCLIDKKTVRQRTVENTKSRRHATLLYHFNVNNEERLRVCKTMFLNTLAVGEWTILNWVSSNSLNQDCSKEQSTLNRNNGPKEIITEFFNLLPKLESHYCRKNSSKLYLEPVWQTKAQLFREYKSYCEKRQEQHSSICLFYSVFEELNLSIFTPRKDQCDICCAFEKKNIDVGTYNLHLKRKEEARAEKEQDKQKAKVENIGVFTMDLQAVLLCPSLKASILYYKRKLKVHNFCLYNLNTSEGYCYLWDESEGGLSADEFSSVICDFITSQANTYHNIILYSDGCTYQNRNCILANALLLTAVKLGVTITQKFLEKGHTQMECDSMHSSIEKKLKNREVYLPATYVEACRSAHFSKTPYKVQYLDHTFFKKYSSLNFVKSIRPGFKTGDPTVTDLKLIQYKPSGEMYVKQNFSDSLDTLPRRIQKPQANKQLESLYDSRIPITAAKFQDLQDMKIVLPKDVHNFYDSLPHL